MHRITYGGLSRKGDARAENQDLFHVEARFRLYLVVDGFGSSRAAQVVVGAFTQTIAAAYKARRLHGALTEAAFVAHRAIRTHQFSKTSDLFGAGAELAALLLHDGLARVAWSGGCSVLRHRSTMTEPEWISTSPRRDYALRPTCIGGETLEMSEHLTNAIPGDTFALMSDGVLEVEIGDSGRIVSSQRSFCAEDLSSALLDDVGCSMHFDAQDDATLLCVRVEQADENVYVPELARRMFAEFCARERIDDVALTVKPNRMNRVPGITNDQPYVDLTFECGRTRGEAPSNAIAARFAAELENNQPDLGGPHALHVIPTLGPSERNAVEARIAHARDVADEALRGTRGLQVGPIEVKVGWTGDVRISMAIVRDDIGNADDEDAYAKQIERELRRTDPAIVVWGDYCK